MQLRGEPMANPRGVTLRPGLWQSNVLTPVGGAHFIRGPRGGPLPGNAFQVKGGEEEEVPPSQNLWVGNVTSEITEPMLMERFGKFGEINSISLYPLRNYAFVYFKHIEHAKAAKEGLQGAAMGDNFLKIEFARAGRAPIGFPNQTRSKFGGQFSYCLLDFLSSNSMGLFSVGQSSIPAELVLYFELNGNARLGSIGNEKRVSFSWLMEQKNRCVKGDPSIASSFLGPSSCCKETFPLKSFLLGDFGQPSCESFEDALKQLYLIDSIDEDGLITKIGRQMAELPLEPSLTWLNLLDVLQETHTCNNCILIDSVGFASTI